jgi:ABC-type Fe3+ transport system permease subunit
MSPQDHNKTVIVLFTLIAVFPTLLLCASPWIISKNVSDIPSPRRDEQVLIASIVTGIFILLVLLLWGVVVGLYRRKLWGRRLALFSCIPLLFYCPPVAAYTWWFFHSDGGKRLYGISTMTDGQLPRRG